MSENNTGPDISDTTLGEAGGLTYRLRKPTVSTNQLVPTLIMMHGYGANDGDVYELVPYVDKRVMIVAPRGPGFYSNDPRGSFKWYDMDLQTCEAAPGAPDASVQKLFGFLEQLAQSTGVNIDPAQLYVGGFSQGAVMAFNLVSARPDLFAGVIAHSCPFSAELDHKLRSAALRGKPFFVAHGKQDFLPIAQHGQATAKTLREIGADLSYHEYDFAHETSVQSRHDLADWLNNKIK